MLLVVGANIFFDSTFSIPSIPPDFAASRNRRNRWNRWIRNTLHLVTSSWILSTNQKARILLLVNTDSLGRCHADLQINFQSVTKNRPIILYEQKCASHGRRVCGGRGGRRSRVLSRGDVSGALLSTMSLVSECPNILQ